MEYQPAMEGREKCGQPHPVLLERQVRMPTSAKFDSRFPGICAANSLLGQMQTQDMSYQRHIFKHSKGERLEQAEAEPTGETRGYGGAIATKIPKPVYAID